MAENKTIEQTETGVTVTVKSKRGSGTRDQDTVTVQGHYVDLYEAKSCVTQLNDMLERIIANARSNDPHGIAMSKTQSNETVKQATLTTEERRYLADGYADVDVQLIHGWAVVCHNCEHSFRATTAHRALLYCQYHEEQTNNNHTTHFEPITE